ncbi:ribosomal protein S12 methylthiotransferase accessory factor [Rhizobium sp. RU20A]|uniref:YcaO-like family protein n=1 Tax=Rhizobium sp. RU20A TaxID=1907412 RepID=UPI000953B519|nr:YcaO-like family protein [Rhizobium sp. RU20A]SIR31616.1 ribosomal protein S12 methylthiotransferase accessory factor [Rhizobium sp. RU20A]
MRGDRACSPAETYGRVAGLLPAFGITRVARQTGLDRIGLPVWLALTPNARSIVVAQGKGQTDEDARTSAVMEALERVVAGAPHCPIRQASPDELAAEGQPFLLLTSYLAPHRPAPAADEVIDWITGTDLVDGSLIHLPEEAVVLDRSRLDARYWQSSDGLASGNTLDEAISHAVYERIERDAQVLWQIGPHAGRAASCIAPETYADDPGIAAILSRLAAADMTLRVFDMTSDIGVPCFTAYLVADELLASGTARFVDVTYGAGCHPVPHRAMMRALTEAVQSRITFIGGARDDAFPAVYGRALPDETLRLMAAVPHEVPARPGFEGGFDRLIERLSDLKLGPVIAVRLSGADLPFAVAKVIMPALENPEGRRALRYGSRALAKAMFA